LLCQAFFNLLGVQALDLDLIDFSLETAYLSTRPKPAQNAFFAKPVSPKPPLGGKLFYLL
jgi:hypothetical protein